MKATQRAFFFFFFLTVYNAMVDHGTWVELCEHETRGANINRSRLLEVSGE